MINLKFPSRVIIQTPTLGHTYNRVTQKIGPNPNYFKYTGPVFLGHPLLSLNFTKVLKINAALVKIN